MNSTIDFGNVNYEPRLRRLASDILSKCDSGIFSDTYSSDVVLSINDFCKMTLTKTCACTDCSGCDEESMFHISIVSVKKDGIDPHSICIFKIPREVCEETPQLAVDATVSVFLESFTRFPNLREVPTCIYCTCITPPGDIYCSECRNRACAVDSEPCPICQDSDLAEAIWHELIPCKHVFHSHCIEKVRTSDDNKRKNSFPCPMCRTEINKSTGFRML